MAAKIDYTRIELLTLCERRLRYLGRNLPRMDDRDDPAEFDRLSKLCAVLKLTNVPVRVVTTAEPPKDKRFHYETDERTVYVEHQFPDFHHLDCGDPDDVPFDYVRLPTNPER